MQLAGNIRSNYAKVPGQFTMLLYGGINPTNILAPEGWADKIRNTPLYKISIIFQPYSPAKLNTSKRI